MARPTKKAVVIGETLDSDTPLLIAHFQLVAMKRAKSQGYVNRATAIGEELGKSTIWQLNVQAGAIMRTVGNYYDGKDTVDALTDWHASLKGRLTK